MASTKTSPGVKNLGPTGEQVRLTKNTNGKFEYDPIIIRIANQEVVLT